MTQTSPRTLTDAKVDFAPGLPDLPKSQKNSATKSGTTPNTKKALRPILTWRFNNHKVTVVIRDHPAAAKALLREAGVVDMCLTEHETQCLLPVVELFKYQKLLGLSAKDLKEVTKANWASPLNPVFESQPRAT